MAKIFAIIIFTYFFIVMPVATAYKAVSDGVTQVHRTFAPVK